jgi:hypothetical protein
MYENKIFKRDVCCEFTRRRLRDNRVEKQATAWGLGSSKKSCYLYRISSKEKMSNE